MPQTSHDALKERHCGPARMSVARPQQRGYEVSALAIEDQKRMVHMLLVVAVVEAAFLLSMGGIVGRVEVQKDLLRRATFPRRPT